MADQPAPDNLRDRIAQALDNANHTHPCPVTGSQYWTGCYHPDGSGPSCHTDRRTAAVLAVLPAPADQAAVLHDFLWRLGQSAGDAASEKFLDDNPDLRRMADEAQQAGESKTVAYRTRGTKSPYCVICARQESGAQPLTAAEVTADTACNFCGGRVLAIANETLGAVVNRYFDDEQPEKTDPA